MVRGLTIGIGLAALLLAPSEGRAGACRHGWLTSPPLRGSTLTCEDGDTRCDVGGVAHACTFELELCLNADPGTQAACSPRDVGQVRLAARKSGAVDGATAANEDALFDGLAGIGAFIDGTCTNPGPHQQQACTVNADCDTPGQGDGLCERVANFDPVLHGTNRCTGPVSVTVPLRARGSVYTRDVRRLKVRTDNGGVRTLRLVCRPPERTVSGAYDLTETTSVGDPIYVPTVDQITPVSLSVVADHGGPLMVGHPVEMKAEFDVQGEPFRSSLWYGLQDDGGNYCVIDHVPFDHLSAVYDDAHRATLDEFNQDDGTPQPSLADCERTHACGDPNEQCLAFQRRVRTTEAVYDPSNSDPNIRMPEQPLPGLPSGATETRTETSYLCATQAYAAAAVARAQNAPKVITPADLVGSVQQRHLLGAIDEVPAACAALVGSSNVTAWIAFDPESETQFAQRPDVTAPPPPPGTPLDPDHDVAQRAAVAWSQRLPFTTPIPGVLADAGLDVDFRHLVTGSSVALIDQEDHPKGDLHVDAEYSLDGVPTPAQQAALPGATVSFHFTLQPSGDPRDGCTPPAASLDPVALQIVHTNTDDTTTDVDDEPAPNLTVGAEHDKSFPLYLPPAVRDRIYGDWACWDHFDITGCLSTNLPQTGAGTNDDCATTDVILERDDPPAGAVIESPPPDQTLQAASLFQPLGANACDDNLFAQYAENMKKFYELSNTVQISDFYSYDFMKWIWGSCAYPGSSGWWNIITNAARQKAFFEHAKGFIEDCELRGGVRCYDSWYYNHSPWSLDLTGYRNTFIPYFWNPYNTSLGAYAGFKNDPQGATRSGFDFECAGIATGAVCSEIGYDLARVPELAGRIRDVLQNKRYSSPLAAKISPYGVGRCLDRAYPSLQRINVDEHGRTTVIPDDDVFYTQYLNKVCEKGRYKAEADRIWKQIMSSCTYVSRPFADSGAGIYAGRFVPELYRTYDTGYKAGIKGVAEGGIVNDYVVATPVQQFKLTFGAQGRVYLATDPTSSVSGWVDVYDVFKTWMLGNFYSDILSSNVEAGFHVLTNDIWKISFKLPQGEYSLPNPPELSKEKEKCKYLWKPPMPFRIELCGAVGGTARIDVGAKILKTGIAGVDPNKSDWPGISGTITPGVAITNKGRAGVDVFIASAGLVISLDPTLGVYIPVEVGAKWNLAMPALRRLDFTLAPYIKTSIELRALGGELAGYTRWKIGSSSEETYPIIDWDPLTLAEYVLVKHTWDVSGSKNF